MSDNEINTVCVFQLILDGDSFTNDCYFHKILIQFGTTTPYRTVRLGWKYHGAEIQAQDHQL